MSISKFFISTVLSLTAIASQATVVELVNNGSFEANPMANGGWGVYNNLVGWTGAPNIELRNNVAGAAENGVNYVELDVYGNSVMTQTITGKGLVNLSFWYSARPKTGAGTNTLGFSLGDLHGTVLDTVGNSTSSNFWQHFIGQADLGTSGSAVLSFYALGKSDSYGGSLDNVSVTSIPEPASYALILGGLGLMGWMSRRRKNKSA
jgi:hypothetical protein